MRLCVLEQEVRPPAPAKAPEEVRQETLRLYDESAGYARGQGCKLLICPELGVQMGLSGEQRLSIAEPIPALYTKPSGDNQIALKALSDTARNNGLYLVCSVVEQDDVYYNTTVVFDPAGRVIGRHRKIHLYLEAGLTPSNEKSRKVHIPELGQVELITCFDIFFSEANDDSPSDFALWLTYWFDETPNLTVLATGRAWSMLNGTPILACNARNVRQGTLGAGLFFPDGSGQYSMSFSKDHEALHVFDLSPRCPALIRDPNDVTTPDSVYHPIPTNLSRFDQVPLIQLSGVIRINCQTTSCQIMYELRRLPENVLYVMMAAEGTRSFGNGDRLYMQELYVIAVDKKTRQPSLCSGTPFRSLRMNIGIRDELPSRKVFPFVMGDNLSLVDSSKWRFNPEQVELELENVEFTCAGLFRRIFSKDMATISRRRSQTF